MEEEKNGIEEATQAFKEWLYNFRKIKPAIIENDSAMLDEIEIIGEEIFNKTVEIQENGELKINLAFPIGKNDQVKFLTYKSRIKAGAVAKATMKVKFNDSVGRNNALISAASSEMVAIIEDMDTADQALCSKLIQFYYLY